MKRLLAGRVHLPHRRPQPPRPLPVDLAELRVAVAVRMDLGVLLPEQLQRDAVSLALAVDVRAVRPHPIGRGRNPGEQSGFERRVVELGRQRPADPALGQPLQIQRDRAQADGARLGYRPVRRPLLVLEPQNLMVDHHRQVVVQGHPTLEMLRGLVP